MDWVYTIPFGFHLFRASLVFFLLAIPKNHPHREVLLILILLLGIASDLLDGTIARVLKITSWSSLAWGDYGSDYFFFIGYLLIVGNKISLAKNRERKRLSPEERKVQAAKTRKVLFFWGFLTFMLLAEIYILFFYRAFTMKL